MTPQFLSTHIHKLIHLNVLYTFYIYVFEWNICYNTYYIGRDTHSNAAHIELLLKIVPQKFHTLNFFFSISCTLSYSQLTPHCWIFFFWESYTQYPLTISPKTMAFHGYHQNLTNKKNTQPNFLLPLWMYMAPAPPFPTPWLFTKFSHWVAVLVVEYRVQSQGRNTFSALIFCSRQNCAP